jgi:cell division protein FtsL
MPPRRVSGPVSRPHGRPLTRPHSGHQEPFAARAVAGTIAFLRSLPDHRWLDRLVRGRAWIPVLGVLLAGIVATQVEVLKLGASTGRWVARSDALSGRNQALQASVAALSDDQRIERLAAQMGMVMPAPTAVSFLPLAPKGGIQTALRAIHSPDSAQFLAALAASQAAALSAQSTTQATSPTGVAASPAAPGSPAGTATVTAAAATQSTAPAPAASGSTPAAQAGTPATTQAPAAPVTGATTGGAATASGGTSQQTTGG